MKCHATIVALPLVALLCASIAFGDVDVNVGDSWSSLSAGNPEGTVFRIKRGRHKKQSVFPKNGQQFIGETGAIMDGDRNNGGPSLAFRGATSGGRAADNVVIKNLEITEYGNSAQSGAIQSRSGDVIASGWIIENCDIHHNSGGGIVIGHGFKIRNCAFHHMDQICLLGGHNGSLVEDCEVAYGNWWRKYGWGWEAGGSKFWRSNDLIVRRNYSHHHYGPGFWSDIMNDRISYEGNLVEDNEVFGIFHEISYAGEFWCNTVRNNAIGNKPSWSKSAQIHITASTDCDVHHNWVTTHKAGGHGIRVMHKNRGSAYYSCENHWVHHNHVTHLADFAQTGIELESWDEGWNASFWTKGHYMNNNVYHVPDLEAKAWRFGPTPENLKTWAEMKASGQEAGGTADTNLDPGPPDCPECEELWEPQII
ncbi:MAG: hypothetical protein GF418_06305, partial [Chitinivibrionales bacterium]|nr:hypothetical protein [Chitinivibrionales bacterium]MBD3395223.1 hypothetical protein [Chitinivibrionales bacterium]